MNGNHSLGTFELSRMFVVIDPKKTMMFAMVTWLLLSKIGLSLWGVRLNHA
ncbi:hypothetical protein P154DRAFT_225823 [Amniculicola lignicola CBS 123094]|uniref:Copper transporter n=1 Tax=Amniculicola lignicola CBS 123094 TaxID=1392246 RepID=A0A6A5WCQ0_9PLEO|nr:hypothetical protein P154DRAFT_225823 [Amniculicola lignicola CBS 123094]